MVTTDPGARQRTQRMRAALGVSPEARATMAHTPHDLPAACPNCGASLAAEPPPGFCPQCGQETTLHAPTLFEFAHEFIGHYVALEGPLWRTLRALVAHPGRLTREYFAGRRRRYVLPLRLYLSASFVFFLVVKVFGATIGFDVQIAPAIDVHGRPITAATDPVKYRAVIDEANGCVAHPGSCNWYTTLGSRVALKAAGLSGHPDEIAGRFIALAPYAVFVLLPLFAAIVMLAYRARHVAYGAHFVFSLHTHSFLFLALAALALLPDRIVLIALLVLPLHAFLSMHRVYGGRWWATLARAALVTLLYGAALFVAMAALGIGSVMGA